MKIIYTLIHSLMICLLPIPSALALDWAPCPSSAEIKFSNVYMTFPDYIDNHLYDAYASSIISNQRTWYLAVAGVEASDSLTAYKQAQNALSSAGNSVELVSSSTSGAGFNYACIYSTAVSPHTIVIASTFSASTAQLSHLANGVR